MKLFTFLIILFMGFQQVYSADDPLSTTPPNLLFELLGLNGDLETAQRPKYLSPSSMTLSPDRKKIYIVEKTAKQVDVFSVVSNTVTNSFLMPNEPTGIAVDSAGTHLYVTCASECWPSGMVCVVNAASGSIENRIPVGHMARSPVLSPDGKNLYVCNWLEGTISFIDILAARETKRVPAIRESYSMAISKNGNSLIIANLIPDGIATDKTVASKICFISTSTGEIEKEIKMYPGSHSTMNVRLSPDGKYAFVPHLIANFTQVANKVVTGWTHSNNLAIIDVENQTILNDIEIDYNPQMGLANPWDVACTDDSKWICIAHAGYDVISVIDLPALFTKLAGKSDVSRDYLFMNGLIKKVELNVRSPRCILTIGSKAYVAGFFSHSLEVVDVSAASPTPTKYALAPDKPLTMERKGESFFYNANICEGQWQTCASCHPFTRPDGINWILSDATNAASKNAKSMLLSWQTPPTNWTGRRVNTFESIRMGVSLELRTDPSAEAALSLDTFFMRLKPMPSPKLVKGKLSESAQRGRAIYYDVNKTNCIRCHPAPLFTNLQPTNAGVLDDLDNSAFDTPSIIEAWRTGPYDHLGSIESIEDVLKVPGHAKLDKLSPSEFKDLIEYVLSL